MSDLRGARWRRVSVLGTAVAVVAVVASACLPPAPAAPPATTTTKPPATDRPRRSRRPPLRRGRRPPVVQARRPPAPGEAPTSGTSSKDRYAAVVRRGSHVEVVTRHAGSAAEVARFRADAAAEGDSPRVRGPTARCTRRRRPPPGGSSPRTSPRRGPSRPRRRGPASGWRSSTPEPTPASTTGWTRCTPSTPIWPVVGTRRTPPISSLLARGRRPVTSDPNGHGTHVAGIIAANDDSQGVVGGAPGATLVTVRVLDATAAGTTATSPPGCCGPPTRPRATPRSSA